MAERPGLLEMLGQTWPAKMAKSAWEAAKLPGDVYAGRTDPLSEEGIGRAADLAGMVMGGTYAGAPAGAVGAGAVKPIRAYHGSPHDFDRFDLSKIGTGEGAQAYGHGLYFAENPAVAGSYKAAGQPSYLGTDRITAAQDLLREAGGDRAAALNLAQARMSGTTKYGEGKLWTDVINNFDDLVGKGPGRMYEVNINAAPEQFLDWDKPLAQMGPEARKALDEIWGLPSSQTQQTMTGQDVYRAISSSHTPEGFKPFTALTTQNMREAGIPGIKYLDQGSRGPQNYIARHPQGGTFEFPSEAEAKAYVARNPEYQLEAPKSSSNYVLFRDDIIDIVKKYGLAGAAAMYGISQDEAKAAMGDDKDKKMHIGNKTYENK